MKFLEVARFEIASQLRRATIWISFVALLAFACLITLAADPADAQVMLNGPFAIVFVSVLAGIIWLFIGGSVAGEAAARDHHTGMHPLVYSLPLRKTEYLGGRFVAACFVNVLILLAIPVGLLLAGAISGADPARFAPFRPAAYLSAFGVVTLPFVLVVTAIQFSWSVAQRRAMASYVASGAIFFASHFGLFAILRLLDREDLLTELDLVGLGGVLLSIGERLTPAEQNTSLIALEPALILNRALWLGMAAGALMIAWRRFRFAHAAGKRRRRIVSWPGRRARPSAPSVTVREARPIVVPEVARTFGFETRVRQTIAIATASFRRATGGRLGLAAAALFALHLIVLLPEYMRFMGVPLRPDTGHILSKFTAPLTEGRSPLVVIPLLIAYFAGELYWRERDAGIDEISDAAPLPDAACLAGKLLGLGLGIAAWITLLASSAILGQLAMGHQDLDVPLYLAALFGLQLPEYLLFAVLALAIHAVTNQKYLGHILAIAALGLIAFAPVLGIRHHLLVYSASPEWSWSDMRGFGPNLGPWMWFKLYWAGWALLLLAGASLLSARGRESALPSRLRMARERFDGPMLRTVAVAAILVMATGGFVFYNTNVLNAFPGRGAISGEAADYERRYRRYEGLPQPVLVATTLRVEIFPGDRRAEIRGTHRFMNRSGKPIDTILVATSTELRTTRLAFDRATVAGTEDRRLGHSTFRLAEPLAPGDSMSLDFAVEYATRGFRNDGVDAYVVANGTMFGNQGWLPALGYQPARELRDPADRLAHGLDARPSLPGTLGDVAARHYAGGAEAIDFEAVIGTAGDQVAVAPGTLRRTWTEGGRRYFHYASDAPIRNEYLLFSARYAVHEAEWIDPHDASAAPVSIQVLHHPAHTANLGRMVRSIQVSLTRFSAEFGPYPYRHLRFVERPGGDGGMSADASSVAFDEGFDRMNPDPSRGLDLPYYVVAHEVAHQWWGAQVAPAAVEGRWLMTESLAVYSGMQVLREGYDDDQVRRYLALVREIYEFPRSRAAVPLLRADGSFLGYRKGPLALYALSRYIGEDRVNEALRQLVEMHAGRPAPLPTSLDLFREIEAVTPDSLRYLLHDLFEANTYWDLETEAVSADSTAGGWVVAIDVSARKMVVDTAGRETEVPMNDWIEIGVYAPVTPGVHVLAQPLHLARHRVRSGRQTIVVNVPDEPARAGIDPAHLLIDLVPDDNVERIRKPGDAAMDLL